MKLKVRLRINAEDIKTGIDTYARMNNGKNPNYLIVNEESMQLLKNTFYYYLPKQYEEEKYFATLFGIPVAICDKLETGVVDFV